MKAMLRRSGSGILLTALFCAVLLSLAACSVGPNYKRPDVTVPTAYRGVASESPPTAPTAPATPSTGASSLGDEKWWEVFRTRNCKV